MVITDRGEETKLIISKLKNRSAVPAPVLSTALYSRSSSRGEAEFADKLLSAMR